MRILKKGLLCVKKSVFKLAEYSIFYLCSQMQQVNKVYISLGSNIRPRHYYMSEALRLLEETAGRIVAHSSLYETESWGFRAETPFLNSVAELETGLNPFALLKQLKKIEEKLGRTEKGKPYKSRKIDLDIISFNNEVIRTEQLTLPHVYVAQRRFVLLPLAEIAPDWIHPVLLKSSTTLLKECPDKLKVTRLEEVAANAL